MAKKVLVACEESQRVCTEFRNKGYCAFSCDIISPSGNHPEWHIKTDVRHILNGHCWIVTMEDVGVWIDKWDLIIAHPPCTYLTVTGNRWFNVDKYGEKAIERKKEREKAIDFFMDIVNAKCEKIAIENPIGIMSTVYQKPTQIIQPWMFAYDESEKTEKSTCLWLKNLPMLIPKFTEKPIIHYHESPSGKRQTEWYYTTRCLPHKERAKMASKTFIGIAKAMADQWGKEI